MGGGGDYNSTFDFFASRAEDSEEFYGLGDLFRDIEEEFTGVDAVFEKIGGDLLDFLEARLGDDKGAEGETNRKQTRANKEKKTTTRTTSGNSSSNRSKKKKNPNAASSASFDAEFELQELKKQMKKL